MLSLNLVTMRFSCCSMSIPSSNLAMSRLVAIVERNYMEERNMNPQPLAISGRAVILYLSTVPLQP